jgi:hypothetical protein
MDNNKNNTAINRVRAKMLRKLMMSVMQTGVFFPLEIVASSHDYRRFHHLFIAAVVIIFSYH